MSELTEDSVRAEVRAWLEGELESRAGPGRMAQQAGRSGLGRPALAEAEWYGRDLPGPGAGGGGGIRQGHRRDRRRQGRHPHSGRATILAHGTDLHKEKYLLRRILTGEDTWCQLFSEPGSGSDVAGAVTRAELQRQPVGRERAEGLDDQRAQGALGPAAGPDRLGRAKHKGLSYFIIDMKQPGVNVQPLRQMNGHASFNQVFLTDAAGRTGVPGRQTVGDGWAVTTTTLMHERRGADGLRTWAIGIGPEGPRLRRGAGRNRHHHGAVQMVSAARGPGRPDDAAGEGDRGINDPVVRQEIAKAAGDVQGRRMDGAGARATAQSKASRRGPKGRWASWHRQPRRPDAAARVHTAARRRRTRC
jgi:alkylation response protein AidB-like acyl-CoA dehydrogenase